MQHNRQRMQRSNPDDILEDFKSPDAKDVDIWGVLEKRKEKGLWDGEIEVIETTSHNLSKGDHYYVVEDARRRSIKCLSCNMPHGGILEPHRLHRYTIKDGVLYLDDKATNTTPEGFRPE